MRDEGSVREWFYGLPNMDIPFITHFSVIHEPHIERCNRHQLIDILFLSVCAMLSGAEGWDDIEDFGTAKLAWLKGYLLFEDGIPRHDTIASVLSRLNPAEAIHIYTDPSQHTLCRATYNKLR